MNKWFKWLLVLFLLVFVSGIIHAYNVVVQLRFYQGHRENGETPGVIVTSYYLENESKTGGFGYVKVEEEIDSLKHIYKLKKVQQVASLDVVLKGDRQDHQSHQVKLNGRKLWIGLNTIPGKRDRFGIKISEIGDKKTPLLASEIIVPEGKTAVLGFKDSQEKIYFLAFSRKTKEQSMAEKLGVKSIEIPGRLKFVDPEYPEEALKKGIDGEVVMVGQTDLEGNIGAPEVLKGHPLLVEATKKALKQWKYSVWKLDGIKKPMDFSLIFIFRLPGKTKASDREILDRCRPLLRAKKTEKRLPQIWELVSVTGKAAGVEKEKGKSLAEKLGAKSIKAPILVRRVTPEYSDQALEQKIQGTVILKGVTDTEGNVENVKVFKGPDLLVKESIEVVKLWKYIPWKIDGVPTPVTFHLVIIFRLEKMSSEELDRMSKEALQISEKLTKNEKKQEIPTIIEIVQVEGK